jgi:predicted dehydrogenase
MAKVRLGIVGTGGMANHQADNFKKLRGVELRSCLDVVPGRAEAFAERHGVRLVAADLGALLDAVDAVAVVTPDRFHYEPALRALEAGKHLLCEKPLTVELSEARKLAAAAKKAAKRGVIGMVNFSYRRSAALSKAIELCEKGRLGELRHAHGFYLQCWVAAPIWGHWSNESWLWRLQTAAGSGGVLGDVGCHLLDLATSVTGSVREIRCALGNYEKVGLDGRSYKSWKGKKLDANDSAVIELRFARGGMGVLETTRWATGHTNHLRLEVFGTRGALMFDLDRSYDKLDVCLGEDSDRARWKTLDLRPAPSIYERFVSAIQSGRPAQPDIRRGAEIQAYLDACERSARSGRWEKVRAWD